MDLLLMTYAHCIGTGPAGADPGLVVGGGANPLGGANPIYLYIF